MRTSKSWGLRGTTKHFKLNTRVVYFKPIGTIEENSVEETVALQESNTLRVEEPIEEDPLAESIRLAVERAERRARRRNGNDTQDPRLGVNSNTLFK